MLHVKDVPAESLIISEFCSRGEDYITIQNLTGAAVTLSRYVLSDGTYEYHFESGDTIAAGESITVYGEESKNAPASARKAVFKLAEDELLTLKDASGKTVDSVKIPNSHTGFVFRRNSYTGQFEEVNP